MMMFCTDIDNTLIYSHRHPLSVKKITAEYLNGREQAFMPAELYDLLVTQKDRIMIIPVTVRTPAQYERLKIFENFCTYAVVCGGAVLLKNGVPDNDWTNDSLKTAGDEIDSVRLAGDIMKEYTGGRNFHECLPFIVYAKTEYPDDLKKYLCDKNIGGVNIFRDSRKVYCTAASLTKGNAVKRLAEKFSPGKIIAAGDGEQDIYMLSAADASIFPGKFEDIITSPEKIVSDSEFLCGDIFEYLKKILKNDG